MTDKILTKQDYIDEVEILKQKFDNKKINKKEFLELQIEYFKQALKNLKLNKAEKMQMKQGLNLSQMTLKMLSAFGK